MIRPANSPGPCLVCGRITWNVNSEKMVHMCSEDCEKELKDTNQNNQGIAEIIEYLKETK